MSDPTTVAASLVLAAPVVVGSIVDEQVVAAAVSDPGPGGRVVLRSYSSGAPRPTRPTPASLWIAGDSYHDPEVNWLTDDEGIGKRVAEGLGLGPGHVRNIAVSGGAASIHTTGCSYAAVWQDLAPAAPSEGEPYVHRNGGLGIVKLNTNDATRLMSGAQEAAFRAASLAIGARWEAAAVWQHDATGVVVTGPGWRELLWADLGAEPYADDPHDPAEPHGGGTGCWVTDTVGDVLEVPVPAGHLGALDVYLIGGHYGATAEVSIDGSYVTTVATGGLGVRSTFTGDVVIDNRVGLVVRLTDVPADAEVVSFEVTAVEAGEAGAPGEFRFDSFAVPAPAPAPLLWGECAKITTPGGFWAFVTHEASETYTGWVREVADELNARHAPYTPHGVAPLLEVYTDTSRGPGDGDGAGHPTALGALDTAAAFLDTYLSLSVRREVALPHADWVTDEAGPAGPAGFGLLGGSGPPGEYATTFDGLDGAAPDAAFSVTSWGITNAPTWALDGTGACRRLASGSPKPSVLGRAAGLTSTVEAVLDDSGQNNHGLAARTKPDGDGLRLVISEVFGNYSLQSWRGGSVPVWTQTIVGVHVAGTRVRLTVTESETEDATEVRVYIDGALTSTGVVTLPDAERHLDGTQWGLHAPGHFLGTATETKWRDLAVGNVPEAADGWWYLDTASGDLFGPYDAEGSTWGGPIALAAGAAAGDDPRFGGVIAGWLIAEGGATIATGVKRLWRSAEHDGTLTGWRVMSDGAATVEVTPIRCAFADFPPDSADTMVGAGAAPTLTAEAAAEGSDLTDWAATFAAGDVFDVEVTANTDATWIVVELLGTYDDPDTPEA